jgi:hypothetical protein
MRRGGIVMRSIVEIARGSVLAISILSAAGGEAHTDRLFPISATGTLLNFPHQYGPASVKVVRFGSKAEPDREPEVVVRIGTHTYELPLCLAHLFMQPPNMTIRAHGSWSHDFSLLPPYLAIDIPYREGDDFEWAGYQLLFDMTSATLIEVRKSEILSGGGMSQGTITESEACDEDLFGFASEPSPPSN